MLIRSQHCYFHGVELGEYSNTLIKIMLRHSPKCYVIVLLMPTGPRNRIKKVVFKKPRNKKCFNCELCARKTRRTLTAQYRVIRTNGTFFLKKKKAFVSETRQFSFI